MRPRSALKAVTRQASAMLSAPVRRCRLSAVFLKLAMTWGAVPVRTVERSTRKLLVIPSVELNATAGGPEHDAHVLALGVEADPEIPENDFAPLAAFLFDEEQAIVRVIDNAGHRTEKRAAWKAAPRMRTAGPKGPALLNATGCQLPAAS